MFQTASAAEWIARSQGAPGVRPHSLYKGKPFDWVQAQQMVRVRTESVVWFVDHLLRVTQAPWPSGPAPGTRRAEKDFHEQRDDVQKKATTPRNAAVRSLRLMIDLTANFTQWMDPQNQFQGLSAAGHDLTDAAERTLAWKSLAAYRDKLEQAYQDFFDNTSEDPALDRPATTPATTRTATGRVRRRRNGPAAVLGRRGARSPTTPRHRATIPPPITGSRRTSRAIGDLMQSSMQWESSR